MNRFLKNSLSRFIGSVNRIQPILTSIQFSRQFSGNLERDPCESVEGLVRCPANHVPLSPITFLERSAKVYRDRTSLVYGSVKYTWKETHERCLRLASALTHLGISPGDVVATLAPNIPAMHELHFAVPMAGAVICTLNTRHDSAMLSVLLRHSEAKVIFVDYQLLEIARGALDLLVSTESKLPILVLVPESDDSSQTTITSDTYEYERLLASGHTEFSIRRPRNELDPIITEVPISMPSRHFFFMEWAQCLFIFGQCLCFTATGGASFGDSQPSVALTYALEVSTPKAIFQNIALHKVTHMGGAPTVLNMIVNSPSNDRCPLPHKVEVMTGGAPPPPQILLKMEELGFGLSHLYGLTETYGPGTSCVWKPEWDSLPQDERLKLKARQGVQHLGLEEVDIKDSITMKSIPADGKTVGEVMFRGNTVMSGYLKDLEATQEAFRGGWFRSGDLAVKHPDGYIEVKDRSKDIIISGGENISSVEVETTLFSHPAVLEAAVVARPDDHWGQTPCAFVKLKEGFSVDAQEVIKFCRDRLPHYMAPRTVIFEDLPKTSTGKVQKFVLREKAKALGSLSKWKE
ncbi:hypothetical protein HYC85_002074 [Camellia sinensis]|uniref:4-coumarate--CoA ligase n=1 Tax=Camellia sinensis TaxID=4442 RepID=A0A7J7I7R7_CAMSI|nr:hypothetical protein HYC85_002074 [Camellia sinensis]